MRGRREHFDHRARNEQQQDVVIDVIHRPQRRHTEGEQRQRHPSERMPSALDPSPRGRVRREHHHELHGFDERSVVAVEEPTGYADRVDRASIGRNPDDGFHQPRVGQHHRVPDGMRVPCDERSQRRNDRERQYQQHSR